MGCALVGGLIGLGLDSRSSGSDLTGGFSIPIAPFAILGDRDWNFTGSLCKSKSIGNLSLDEKINYFKSRVNK